MEKTNYRSTNLIIQTILEGIIKAEKDKFNPKKGIVKSHLIKFCGLKQVTAEKYLSKLENAEYISSHTEKWGDREINMYEITQKGRERYNWFVMINTEMEES